MSTMLALVLIAVGLLLSRLPVKCEHNCTHCESAEQRRKRAEADLQAEYARKQKLMMQCDECGGYHVPHEKETE